MKNLKIDITNQLLGIPFCIMAFCAHGQESLPRDELYGFRLGQYKEVVFNELGDPDHTRVLDDSSIVDFYYIAGDTTTYVGFQYLPSRPKEIYSIQLTGTKTDRLFYGIQLGEDEQKAVSILGKPDTLLHQEFNDREVQILKYESGNLSILLSNGIIESIRIWNEDVKEHLKFPDITDIYNVLSTGDSQLICDILSPNLEVYYCDKVIRWKNSFYKDIRLEKSSVYDFVVSKEFGLASLGEKNYPTDVNIRVIRGAGTFPVIKFPKESLVSEVVLNFQQGRYKIWEIKYKCE